MDALQFCYWLQGYFEISYIPDLTRDQVEVIKDHLKLVFNKVTPDRNKDVVPNIYPQWPHCGSTTIPTKDKYISLCATNTDNVLTCHSETGVGPNFECLQWYPGASC